MPASFFEGVLGAAKEDERDEEDEEEEDEKDEKGIAEGEWVEKDEVDEEEGKGSGGERNEGKDCAEGWDGRLLMSVRGRDTLNPLSSSLSSPGCRRSTLLHLFRWRSALSSSTA